MVMNSLSLILVFRKHKNFPLLALKGTKFVTKEQKLLI